MRKPDIEGGREDQRSDLELVAAVNRGDAAAFDALYLRYRDWAVSLAYRFTRDRQLSLDIMQETFMYLLRQFPGFELRVQLKSFLYPAVRHLAISHQSRIRRAAAAGGSGDAAGPNADDPSIADEKLHHLREAVQSLPAGQREVLLLRFADELALEEIATALQVPVGTVKSRLHHALAALRADSRLAEFFPLQ